MSQTNFKRRFSFIVCVLAAVLGVGIYEGRGQSAGSVISSAKASVYARTSDQSPVVATLDKDSPVTVRMMISGGAECWLEINWPGQAAPNGYVPCRDVRLPAAPGSSGPGSRLEPQGASAAATPQPAAAPTNPPFRFTTRGAIALTHVRVIDGTGAPGKDDQTLVLEGGRIKAIGDAATTSVAGVAQVIDLRGHTAFPGLVGMHDHLFYALPPGTQNREQAWSFPRLYLAAGVTSIRTAGALDLGADLRLKQQIDSGGGTGPHIYPSSAYLDSAAGSQESPDRLLHLAVQQISAGARSLKVYTGVRRSELAAVVQAAHGLGVRVTGHLCATGFTEAATAGIDNLEHGLIVDTEFYSRKRPGVCPDVNPVLAELVQMDVRGPQIQRLIQTLVQRRVAITSTLPVFESFAGERMLQMDTRALALLAPEVRQAYTARRDFYARNPDGIGAAMLQKEMEFEYEFVRAGGLLMAGVDPTGWGGVIAGYGDQRELELLVEAGFTAEQAIRIGSYHGAIFLGQANRIGTLAQGKEADLVVVRGNPSADMTSIRETAIVFKDGVAYDPEAIARSVRGQVGRQ